MFSRVLRRRKRNVKYYIQAAERKSKKGARAFGRVPAFTSRALESFARDCRRREAESLSSEKLNWNSKNSDVTGRYFKTEREGFSVITRTTDMASANSRSSASLHKTKGVNLRRAK